MLEKKSVGGRGPGLDENSIISYVCISIPSATAFVSVMWRNKKQNVIASVQQIAIVHYRMKNVIGINCTKVLMKSTDVADEPVTKFDPKP